MKNKIRKKWRINKLLAGLIACGLCLCFPFLLSASPAVDTLYQSSHSSASEARTKSTSNEFIKNTLLDANKTEELNIPVAVQATEIAYKLTNATPVFRSPSTKVAAIAHLNRDDEIELLGTISDGMVKIRFNQKSIGYVDKAVLNKETVAKLIVEEIPWANPKFVFNLFTEKDNRTLNEKLEYIQGIYKNSNYFNTSFININGLSQDWAATITTTTPCHHSENGLRFCQSYLGLTAQMFDEDQNIQSLGFASLISDYLFGKDTPVTKVYNFEELQVGDHIRLIESQHSMIIADRGKDSLTILECNADYESCQISWGRVITKEDIEKEEHLYLSRR